MLHAIHRLGGRGWPLEAQTEGATRALQELIPDVDVNGHTPSDQESHVDQRLGAEKAVEARQMAEQVARRAEHQAAKAQRLLQNGWTSEGREHQAIEKWHGHPKG